MRTLAYLRDWIPATMASSRTDLGALGARPLEFADVYAAEFGFVYRVVARLAGGAEVEDLVQEVFVVVHRRLHEFRGEARLSTWLFRIAYHTVGAHVRRERLRRRLRELFARSAGAPPLHETASDALDRARHVRAALERLPYAQRSVLVLFEVEGASTTELAEAFGVPVGTIHRRLHDARRAFAKHYAASHGDPA